MVRKHRQSLPNFPSGHSKLYWNVMVGDSFKLGSFPVAAVDAFRLFRLDSKAFPPISARILEKPSHLQVTRVVEGGKAAEQRRKGKTGGAGMDERAEGEDKEREAGGGGWRGPRREK